MALSTHGQVIGLIYSSKTTNSCPLNPLSLPPLEVWNRFRNIPTVWSRDHNGFHVFYPILTVFSRWENIFTTPRHHQIGYQTSYLKSTSLGLKAGWIFIPYQSKLTISMKIFTHSCKPNILANSVSVADLGWKSAAHVWPIFPWVFN